MELVSVSIKGWKRFTQKVTLQTNGKLVALLGANEAGKSSALSALEFLDSRRDAEQFEISRGSQASDVEIIGYYSLSPAELKRAGLNASTRAVLTKRASGKATFELQPAPPPRNTARRQKAADQGRRIIGHKKAGEIFSDDYSERFERLIKTFASDKEDLEEEVLTEISEFSETWRNLKLDTTPKYFRTFGQSLSILHQTESAQNPSEIALKAVSGMFPSVLMFDQAYRNLEAEYAVDNLKSKIPLALECLASIAALDFNSLFEAIDTGNPGDIETIRSRANRKLKSEFQKFWKQSNVWPVFVINGGVIQVLIENEGDQFTALAERSDGLRQFVALQSFAMRERMKSSILLIDEAETHLHYDAQADLVQMLYRQEVAKKVVYTTHSAGCLPEDLGNGVRLVKARDETPSESQIINRFWGAKDTGYSPLLIGMGASTLAFFPTRKALQVEGETEMLLLPSMIRQALGECVLGFQVVPGLSKANKSQLPVASNGSGNIHYLVDGDNGGTSLKRELLKNKIDEGDISMLAVSDGSTCQLEDFLNSKLLVSAVNALIGKFYPGSRNVDEKGLTSVGKFKILDKKFKSSTGKGLQKVDLAYEILSLACDDPNLILIDGHHAPQFSGLAESIMKKFYPEWQRKLAEGHPYKGRVSAYTAAAVSARAAGE